LKVVLGPGTNETNQFQVEWREKTSQHGVNGSAQKRSWLQRMALVLLCEQGSGQTPFQQIKVHLFGSARLGPCVDGAGNARCRRVLLTTMMSHQRHIAFG